MLDTDTPEIPNEDEAEYFFTSLGPLPKNEATNITKDLVNRSFTHAIIGTIPIIEPTLDNSNPATGFTTPEASNADPFSYITSDRYTADTFYRIMIDTGASKRSTAAYGQFLAYSKTHTTTLDTARARLVNVQFGIGSACSIGSVTVKTPVGTVEFHIVQVDTPFLLCLSDMDSLRVYYNNLTNIFIILTESVPVVRRFGHPFLQWEDSLRTYMMTSLDQNSCLLNETELRRLHRRFGHPAADRLHRILERSGHDKVSKRTIEYSPVPLRRCSIVR
jgi:hypothetical protein